LCCVRWLRDLHSFPTRRSSDLTPPQELIPQFDLVKEVIEAFNFPNIGLQHFEADDCIGTLATMYANDHDVMILTGDQDILQLVEDRKSTRLNSSHVSISYAVFC